MADPATISVPVESLTISQQTTIALVGNPNSGKSTLFNRLTGLRQKTANYPGVTVEKHVGKLALDGSLFDIIDLPGIYSLSPNSADEQIAVDVLLGRVPGTPRPDVILAVVDSTRLYQGLYLLQQLAEFGQPIIVALTMTDDAITKRIQVDADLLSNQLGGIPVCRIVATTGRGVGDLKSAVRDALEQAPARRDPYWPELRWAAETLSAEAGETSLSIVEIERALIDDDPVAVLALRDALGPSGEAQILAQRAALCGTEPPLAVEARTRYRWISDALPKLEIKTPAPVRWGAKLATWLNRPFPATALFLVLMAVIFQAVFAWATPMMDLIDAGTSGLGASLQSVIPEGMVASFLADGLIGGVGSVIIFLPQILILFLFIIVMEDTGYLARTAFLMDRVMVSVGLSGQSVIPLISGFACAVPGIMATRVIPDRRDRIATIIAAPFMTCSARLPVYALLIAAFVPGRSVGFANLQGIVLFGLYMLGILGGVGTALLLKRSALRGPKPTFILALPEFHVPSIRTVVMKLLDRARIFLRRAGTVIFAVAVVVWALAYFPRSGDIETNRLAAITVASESLVAGEALEAELARIDKRRLGRATESELAWTRRAVRGAPLCAARLGLAGLRSCHRRFPGPRSGRGGTRHHLRGRCRC